MISLICRIYDTEEPIYGTEAESWTQRTDWWSPRSLHSYFFLSEKRINRLGKAQCAFRSSVKSPSDFVYHQVFLSFEGNRNGQTGKVPGTGGWGGTLGLAYANLCA